jgi:hypothetical protein
MEEFINNINNNLVWYAHPDLCDYTHQIKLNFTHNDAGQFILVDSNNYTNCPNHIYSGSFLIDKNIIIFSFRESIYLTKQVEFIVIKKIIENKINHILILDVSPFDFSSVLLDRKLGLYDTNKLDANIHDFPLIFILQ